MKLTVQIKLKPTSEQAAILGQTLETCNRACNWLSELAYKSGATRQFALHKIGYATAKCQFGLTAQAVVRCIAKVSNAYAAQRANRGECICAFRANSAQPFDDRIFRMYPDGRVSIWTIAGRMVVPFVCSDRQREILARRKGEVDLILRRGQWYVMCTCDVPEPALVITEGVLGIDFGVINLAFDSRGRAYSGSPVEAARQHYARRRSGLQRRGTKAAKRRLKKLSGKEARFRKHVNHCISKEIVANAERDRLAIAVEDLTHIRKRVKARKAQRNRLHGWAFAQLRQFVAYKAQLAGIPMVVIDPRNTSRTCPECGVIDKANRKTQATFSCISCGHTAAADYVAARNIRTAGAYQRQSLSSQPCMHG